MSKGGSKTRYYPGYHEQKRSQKEEKNETNPEEPTTEIEPGEDIKNILWPPWHSLNTKKKTEEEKDYLKKYERWNYQRQQEREFREQYEMALDYNAAHIGQNLSSSWQDRVKKWSEAAKADKWKPGSELKELFWWEKAAKGDKLKPDIDLGMEVLQELMKMVEEEKKCSENEPKTKGINKPVEEQPETPYKEILYREDNDTPHQLAHQAPAATMKMQQG